MPKIFASLQLTILAGVVLAAVLYFLAPVIAG